MPGPFHASHAHEPILKYAHKDFPLFPQESTVAEALSNIRQKGLGERIVYFYIMDDAQRLVGVVPTRRLLTANLEQRLSEIMVTRVIKIPEAASVLEACELFVLHRLLAFPVVNAAGQAVGVVDLHQFTDEVLDLAEAQQANAVFETLGFRLEQVRSASALLAFRFRFPWLLATIASGTACAWLASWFETTLAESLVIAFFLALVLALGESVSMQSMTVTIQALRSARLTLRAYLSGLAREVRVAMLLGCASGMVVAAIVWLWRGELASALVIGASIFVSLHLACLFGLSVPWLLHAIKLDPKISAGPITLAVTDIGTLLFYFNLAAAVL